MKANGREIKKNVLPRSMIVMIIACIIGGIIATLIMATKKNANEKVASVEDTETMKKQEEQDSPKALTTITAREPNTNNFTYVTSGDGHQIPVPKGYVASPAEAERYRDGKYETWKKQEDLTFKSATTYYLNQTLTLSSPEGETNPWTENATVGAWQSGNYQVASSTSTIETNEFTVANNGDVVRIAWSVSSQNTANTDYAYYTITNTATSETIGGTSTGIYGTGNGTEEASLIFNNTDVALNAGTYKVEVTYTKDSETDTDLDRAYVKSINVYSTAASSTNPSIEVGSSCNYVWNYDSSIGAWKSGNYNISNSTSTIESNNFTVTEATKVRISWAVCSETTNDYVYYTITNTETGATTGGVSTKKSGTGNGTAEANLTYTNTDVDLVAGTYKVELKYVKNYTTNTNLDRAYLKSIKVYTQNATSDDSFTLRVGSGGFVIYEKNAGETDEQAIEEIEDDLDTAQRERNQWVWIPISNVTDMYHASGNYIYANTYTFSASSYSKGIGNSREPALVSNDDIDHTYLKIYLEGINRNEFLQEMRKEFSEMLESVATYGGFYIGRYETGDINQKVPVIRRKNSNISNVNWYLMYKRCKNLKCTENSVETGMLWGIQWDETLKWLIDTGDKNFYQVSVDSTSWGSYSSATWHDHSNEWPKFQKSNTGANEKWKANNIFDLAGNVLEWTMESAPKSRGVSGPYEDYIGIRYLRGGEYYYNGNSLSTRTYGNSASRMARSVSGSYSNVNYQSSSPYTAFETKGCRAALIIKD